MCDTPQSIGFHHVALRVPNFDEALTFYTQALGLTLRTQWPGAALLQLADGGHLELFAGETPVPEQPSAGYYHMAYRVEDVDAALARAARFGAPTTIEAKNARIGDIDIRCGFCRGPGGESVEFFAEL